MVKKERASNPSDSFNKEWWRGAVIYQIYPLSFMDSNNDGFGDLKGIASKVDYLRWLGVEAIWLSPIYKSPMKDFGYDISDFYDIDPKFGNINDFKDLLSIYHRSGIRVIMDMTFNHTSDVHPWFVESKSSKTNNKRDWYIWSEGKKKHPPNNWRSIFGGSAWDYNDETKDYYLHLYLKNQPDLNWANPEVSSEMFSVCKYWLDLGVDGFRMDSAHTLVKASPNINNRFKLGLYDYDRQHSDNLLHTETRDIWREFRKMINMYPGKILVGEIDPGGWDRAHPEKYYGKDGEEFDLIFSFSLIRIFWSALVFRKTIEGWLKKIPENAWPCLIYNNHDLTRSIDRYTLLRKKYRNARAKIVAAVSLTSKGTPFVYYGEEIGMAEGKVPYDLIQDYLGRRFWPLYKGRDGARTPMQWDGSRYAGFSKKQPWLPISAESSLRNVELEKKDKTSILNFYRDLLGVRKKYMSLSLGDYKNIYCKRGLWVYERFYGQEKTLIILNFRAKKTKYCIGSSEWKQLISSNHLVRVSSDSIVVEKNEAIVLLLK